MTWLSRFLIGFLIVGVLAFFGIQVFRSQIAERVMNRAIEARVGVDRSAGLPDGLHVYLCGTGSPLPDPRRSGPCIGVLAGQTAFVFDVGSGGTRRLGSMGFPMDKLDSLFLTHLHSDHIDGLGELLMQAWIAGNRSEPLPVRGPGGTVEVVDGFNRAYRLDSTYRIAHHGTEVANPGGFGGAAIEFSLPVGPDSRTVVYSSEDITITAVRVDHSPVEPAVGYRIDYKDRSVAISGDTVYSEPFTALAKGSDLMLHEALQPDMVARFAGAADARGASNLAKIFNDILDYHASPADAARSAETAGVDELILVHIVPPLPSRILYPLFLNGADDQFSGRLRIGEDGMLFSLPTASSDISLSREGF